MKNFSPTIFLNLTVERLTMEDHGKLKVIDFHTHLFPDAVAGKAVAKLVDSAMAVPHTDGTAKGLYNSAIDAGIDKCLVMPVLTSPKQFDSVNKFATEINRGSFSEILLSFGGIHPDCDDLEGKIAYLKDCGFKGLKIHPEFQQTDIDDKKYLQIAEAAEKYGLILLTHAGYDASCPSDRHCTPEKLKKFIKNSSCSKLVLAHLGGLQSWLQVMDFICGENVCLDSAHIFPYIDDKLFSLIAEQHGTDKILFATDSPWKDQKEYIAKIKSFKFSEIIEKQIFYENAARLLNLS